MVSRLVQQKGIDLTLEISDALLQAGGRLVSIGRGEPNLEKAMLELARRHPGQVGVHIGFDETEARRIYAGSDFLLMPSRYEPCGLSQLYAQCFGSLPIARCTGGLADTIVDGVTGFLFREETAQSYLDAVMRAINVYHCPSLLNAMRCKAMAAPMFWSDSVEPYNRLYRRLLRNTAPALRGYANDGDPAPLRRPVPRQRPNLLRPLGSGRPRGPGRDRRRPRLAAGRQRQRLVRGDPALSARHPLPLPHRWPPGVPDPASQFQPDGVHGDSQVLDHDAYAWRVDEWRGRPWHEAVIYELHVGLFGSYAEVERFLPRLVELGVTAVELMPLGEFPGRRNWGYDGVLPFAPASAYGTPEQLKHLIDSAHGMGLMVFVDVIYNHFGPDGNYLAQYAAAFFRDDRQTPWGQAIDFRRGEVREFFYENALMWLLDYRIDGLRFDAVHAIPDSAFLVEMARRLRGAAGPERHLHLVLENDDNRASLLRQGYDAQWNDDGHHALHVLLTGENDGYYQDYPEPLRCLARCLAEGFVYQGEANRHGRPRGEPSADLAPDAFVLFLQNHDQVGNRAFGERLSVLAEPQALRLAIALQLLAPMIPLLFMGEECAAREPFLYFTDHQGELADAVREGRRKEFGEFGRFGEGATLASLPDPNAVETFERSRPGLADCDPAWRGFYRQLLEIRHEHLIPRLRGARSLGVTTIAGAALSARWRLGDGSDWRIDFNPSPLEAEVEPPAAATQVLFLDNLACAEYRRGRLSPRSIAVSLEPAHE